MSDQQIDLPASAPGGGDGAKLKLVTVSEIQQFINSLSGLSPIEALHHVRDREVFRSISCLRAPDQTILIKTLKALTGAKVKDLEEEVRAAARKVKSEAVEATREAPAFSEEALSIAADLAACTNLLERLSLDLLNFGVVGEAVVASLVLASGVAPKARNPIHLVVQGPSSSGKSRVVKEVLGLFPGDSALILTGLSDKALFHASGDLDGRILFLEELDAFKDNEYLDYQIRALMSEGQLTYAFAAKDDSGNIRTVEVKVEGNCSVITTTTQRRLHPENATRVLLVQTDASPEQTARIVMAKAKGASEAGNGTSTAPIVEGWKSFLAQVPERRVVIPFAKGLVADFPVNVPRRRRDFQMVLALTQAIALLHYRHRGINEWGRLVATEWDLQQAAKLFLATEWSEAPELNPGVVQAAEAVAAACEAGGKPVTAKDIALQLGTEDRQVRRLLEKAEEFGLIRIHRVEKNLYEAIPGAFRAGRARNLKQVAQVWLSPLLDPPTAQDMAGQVRTGHPKGITGEDFTADRTAGQAGMTEGVGFLAENEEAFTGDHLDRQSEAATNHGGVLPLTGQPPTDRPCPADEDLELPHHEEEA